MSSSFTNAIGYAIPWHKFEEIVLFDCEAHKTRDVLEDTFYNASSEDLTIPLEFHNELFYRTKNVPNLLELKLLAKTYTDGNRKEPELGSAYDLIEIVQGPDEDNPLHIIFFPNLIYKERWYRRNDYLDQMMEQYRPNNKPWKAENRMQYLEEGIDIFCHYIMEKDGTPLDRNDFIFPFTEEEKRRVRETKTYPQIPSEIRWYLKKLNIMDDKGINELRPFLMHFWS